MNVLIPKRQQSPSVVCKLDFEKACDMGEWGFLFYMMERMGFGSKWREWIYSCVSSAQFSVIVNRSLKGFLLTS